MSSLHFEDIMDTSLKVVWSRPTEVNGILQGKSYEIQLNTFGYACKVCLKILDINNMKKLLDLISMHII